MDLLRIVRTDSLEKIKDLFLSSKILINSKWLDYNVLNFALEHGRKDVAKYLLDLNCKVNKPNESTIAIDTPLHHAVRLGDLELVDILLKRQANILVFNYREDTPLHLAFMTREDEMVDHMLALISSKINNLNPVNKRGLSHMHIACARDNATVVLALLEAGINVEHAINLDSSMWAGFTPVHFAVEFKSLDVLKLLKSVHECYHLLKEKNGYTPENLARKHLNRMLVIQYLLSSDSTESYNSNNTKLSHFHVACMKDDSELVKLFIENGATVHNIISKESIFCPLYGPLHFAVESNCKNNVVLLLNQGSDIEQQNSQYMTPLHLALYNENYKDKEQRNRKTIVDFLYKALPVKDIDRPDLNGLNYFHVACTRNDVETVNKCLDHGMDVNSQILYNLRNFSYFTSLHLAVRYRCLEVAEILINHGANVNRSDIGMHGTPLHLAVENGDHLMVELLLKNGARGNAIRPYDDKTMLHLIVECEIQKNQDLDKGIGINSSSKISFCNYIKRFIKYGCNINNRDSNGNTALHIACSNLKDGSACIKHFLYFGADINIENDDGDTPFNLALHNAFYAKAKSYMTLYHHVQKLKTLGTKVSSKNEKCCEKLLTEAKTCDKFSEYISKNSLAYRKWQRLHEIKKLKNTKFKKDFSLYDILFMHTGELINCCKYLQFSEIILAKNFIQSYPVYGHMLKVQFYRGFRNLRTEDLNRLKRVGSEKEVPPRKRLRIR